jgi:hypothetical protein
MNLKDHLLLSRHLIAFCLLFALSWSICFDWCDASDVIVGCSVVAGRACAAVILYTIYIGPRFEYFYNVLEL